MRKRKDGDWGKGGKKEEEEEEEEEDGEGGLEATMMRREKEVGGRGALNVLHSIAIKYLHIMTNDECILQYLAFPLAILPILALQRTLRSCRAPLALNVAVVAPAANRRRPPPPPPHQPVFAC